VKQADRRDMFKKASESVRTSTIMVSPAPINFFSYEDAREHRRRSRWPWISMRM